MKRERPVPGETSPFGSTGEELIDSFRGLPKEPYSRGRRRTKSIEEMVHAAMKLVPAANPGPLQTLAEHWPAIVGTALATRSHPLSVNGEILQVAAASAVARSDLQLRSRQILQKACAVQGCEGLRQLRVAFG